MSELHLATVIADADLADDVELPSRLSGTAGLLRITLVKILTYLTGSASFLEWLQDKIAIFLTAGSNISLTYDDVSGALAIAVSGASYRVGWFYTSAAAVSEILLIHTFTEAVVFPANWAGSKAVVDGTAPDTTLNIDIQKNNVSVGTLAVTTGGVPTFTSAGGAAVNFAVGDRIKLVAPATVNAATNVSGTFEGNS